MNQKCVVCFSVGKNGDGTVNAGKGYILTPEIHFSGNRTINWYKDTYKSDRPVSA